MATLWLEFYGFLLIFATLFSKIWRINKIFDQARTMRRAKIRGVNVIWPALAMTASVTVLLVLMQTLEGGPYIWERVYVLDDFGTPIVSTAKCTAGSLTVIFDALLQVSQILLLLLAGWQFYRARNVSSEYSESKWFSYCVLCTLEILVIAIPLTYMTTTTETLFFIDALKLLIISWSVLGFIFGPKIHYWRKSRRREKRAELEGAAGGGGGGGEGGGGGGSLGGGGGGNSERQNGNMTRQRSRNGVVSEDLRSQVRGIGSARRGTVETARATPEPQDLPRESGSSTAYLGGVRRGGTSSTDSAAARAAKRGASRRGSDGSNSVPEILE